MVAEGILRYYGMAAGKDVNITPSGDDQGRLAALDSGRIDAAVGSPPFDIIATKKDYKILARASDYLKLPQNGLIATVKKIESSPEQMKRVIRGTIEALQFIKNQKEEATDIFARWAKVDREMQKRLLPPMRRDIASTAACPRTRFRPLSRTACCARRWRRKFRFLRSPIAGFWPRHKKNSDQSEYLGRNQHQCKVAS